MSIDLGYIAQQQLEVIGYLAKIQTSIDELRKEVKRIEQDLRWVLPQSIHDAEEPKLP